MRNANPSNLQFLKSKTVNEQLSFIKFTYLKRESIRDTHHQWKKYICKNALFKSTCRYGMNQFKGQRYNVKENKGETHHSMKIL